ncbi:MAG: serine/threonine-protein kinase [Acidobacteria bacterium]|nr:MAG: serine/threonine-protein kinase [Acidobacteriota bacterium]
MALESGSQLGGYEILSRLGTGGMSEVYRARDLTLGREIAIKVLPSLLAQDPDKLARFEREAKILASLNHPNIAVIHGLEHEDDVWYLVLELIPGETLAERIKRAPLTVAEARAIFLQIARALEAAHEKQIIHRDLKPSNVKITEDGVVKLLDFGLGKTLPETRVAGSKTKTFSGGETSPGLVMGTPGYMSPEQARGHEMAKSTDVWSFGVSLFEALTAVHPFARETLPDMFTAVLKEEPPWGRLPSNVPRALGTLLSRCLEKNAHDRIHDIGDVRIQLEDLTVDAVPKTERTGVSRWALVAVILVLPFFVWLFAHDAPTLDRTRPVVRRFVLDLSPTAPISLNGASALAVSPDGERLVYGSRRGARNQLYLRELDQIETVPIPGTEGGTAPFFAPSSNRLGFFVEGKLKTLSLLGGTPETLTDAETPRGASWSDGSILFSPSSRSGLQAVPASGGASASVTDVGDASIRAHRWPSVLPGGTHALVTLWNDDGFAVAVVALDTGDVKELVQNGSYARYASTGHLVFLRDGDLYAAGFDAGSRTLVSEASLVVEDVAQDARTGAAFYDFSEDGALFYVPADAVTTGPATMLLIDRAEVARPIGPPRHSFQVPRLSPDGQFLLVTVQDGDEADIWSLQLDRGNLTRLTFEGSNGAAIWTPDGKRITFSSNRNAAHAIYWKAADGSGNAERLTPDGPLLYATSWSPDGGTLTYTVLDPQSQFDVWLLHFADRETTPLLSSSYNEAGAVFSPDGRFLAYTSDESGREEVYVRAFPGPEGRWQVSTESGNEPQWSRDGKELFFRSGTSLMVADIVLEPSFDAARPRVLMDAPFDQAGSLYANYDVTPDGRNFVMIRSEEDNAADRLHVVLHWFEELKRRVPVN